MVQGNGQVNSLWSRGKSRSIVHGPGEGTDQQPMVQGNGQVNSLWSRGKSRSTVHGEGVQSKVSQLLLWADKRL